jgi:hypothetical protein
LHQTDGLEVTEQVTPEDALGKRRLARADREMGIARPRELRGDLEAGVPPLTTGTGPSGTSLGVR